MALLGLTPSASPLPPLPARTTIARTTNLTRPMQQQHSTHQADHHAVPTQLDIGNLEPTAVVAGTSLTIDEVAFLFKTVSTYDDSELRSNLAAIHQKIGGTIDLEQLVKLARLASQGMLSRADVVCMCAASTQVLSKDDALGAATVSMTLDTSAMFKVLTHRIRLLYAACALHRRRKQHDVGLGQQHSHASAHQSGASRQAKQSMPPPSAADKLRRQLDQSERARKHLTRAISSQVIQVSASCAVSSSERISSFAIQTGLDKVVGAMQLVRRRRVRRAFEGWQQTTEIEVLREEVQRWLPIYAALCMQPALDLWRARLLRAAVWRFLWQSQRQSEEENAAAAIELQRYWRGHRARRYTRWMVLNRAAARIQTRARVFLAKARINQLLRRQRAAIMIARNCELFHGRIRRMADTLDDMTSNKAQCPGVEQQAITRNSQNDCTERNEQGEAQDSGACATVAAQSCVPPRAAQQSLHQLAAERLARLQSAAVLPLQAVARGYLARQHFRQHRCRAERAASCIQWYYRRCSAEKLLKLETQRFIEAATRVQRFWRKRVIGRHQRERTQFQLPTDCSAVYIKAVVVLQRAFRQYLARQPETWTTNQDGVQIHSARSRCQTVGGAHATHLAKVVVIQRAIRAYLARLAYTRDCQVNSSKGADPNTHPTTCSDLACRIQPADELEPQLPHHKHHRSEDQATRIQAMWRGWLGRQVAIQRLHNRRQARSAAVIGRAISRYQQRRRIRIAQLLSLWQIVTRVYVVVRRWLKRQRVITMYRTLRVWRLNGARATLVEQVKEQAQSKKRQAESAIKIQRIMRGSSTRRRIVAQMDNLIALRQERIQRREHKAVTVLQCFVRSVFAKRLLCHKRAFAIEQQRRLEECRQLKKTIDGLYVQHMRALYALRIQRLYRGFRGRVLYAHLLEQAAEQGQDREYRRTLQAAQGIQALWRAYIARKLARKLRQRQLLRRRRRRARRRKQSG